MAKKTAALLPATNKLLVDFGERLKLARLRRKLTAKQVAERAGMSPMTLRSLEAGGAGVTMGAYLSVMQVLGLASDLAKLADADVLGRQLQDARLIGAGAAPKRRAATVTATRNPPPITRLAQKQASARPQDTEPKPKPRATKTAKKAAGVSAGKSSTAATTTDDLVALLRKPKRKGSVAS